MQASGINYTVNTIPNYDAGAVYGRYWYKAGSIKRVTIISVNGNSFDEDAIYAVLTHDKNYNGMDASYVFKAVANGDTSSIISDPNDATLVARLARESTVTNYDCYQVVMDYIQARLGGILGDGTIPHTPSTYEIPAGRITIS